MPELTHTLVTVFVTDMDRSEAFYGSILGLRQSYRFPRTGQAQHIEFKLGQSVLAISSPEGLKSHGMPPPSSGHPFEIGFKTENCDRTVEELRAEGVSVLREPFDSEAGNRVAYVADPDGNWISLYHNR